jgi:hypothetical protein
MIIKHKGGKIMNQQYIDENKKAFDKIIQEMTLGFRNNQPKYLPKPQTTEEGEVVVTRQKKGRVPRYGVKLTQDGEIYVYKYMRVIEQIIVQTYEIEKYKAENEAKDIMCLYILEHVFNNCNIPFETRYNEIISSDTRQGKIKFYGAIFLILLLLAAIIISIVLGNHGAAA